MPQAAVSSTRRVSVTVDKSHVMTTPRFPSGDSEAFDRPIHKSCRRGDEGAVKEWLDRDDRDLNILGEGGCTPLYCAAFAGRAEVVRTLMRKNDEGLAADTPNCSGDTPVHAAVLRGDPPTLDCLVAGGASVSISNAEGQSPLHLAALVGNRTCVAILLKAKADANQKNREGRTPLWLAAWYGRKEVVTELLLDDSIHVDEVDNSGWTTPVWMAARAGHADIVRLLAHRGADVDLGKKDGRSPLFICCYDGLLVSVKALIECGAEINLMPIRGRYRGLTPFDIAKKKKHEGVCRYIEQKMEWEHYHTEIDFKSLASIKSKMHEWLRLSKEYRNSLDADSKGFDIVELQASVNAVIQEILNIYMYYSSVHKIFENAYEQKDEGELALMETCSFIETMEIVLKISDWKEEERLKRKDLVNVAIRYASMSSTGVQFRVFLKEIKASFEARNERMCLDIIRRLQKYIVDRQIRVHELFLVFDADRSSSITIPELLKSIRKIGASLSEAEAQLLGSYFDVNGDGTVAYGEFMDIVSPYTASKRRAGAR